MTVTISRLYDRYSDAQSAVRSLEAAGVPTPTSASSRTILTTGSAGIRKSTVMATASTTGQRVLEKALALAPALVAPPVCLRALVCWLSPAWVQWWPQAGLPRRLSVLPQVLLLEGSWEL